MHSVGKKRGVPARSLSSRVYSKKAQITTFIITGIILLFVIGVLFWLKYKQVEGLEADYELSSEPVTAYIQQCTKTLLEDALTRAGQQGGYVDLEGFDKLSPSLDPFNSDMLSLGDGSLYIPYWYYQKMDSVDRSNMPELYKTYAFDDSVQSQVEMYIEDNLFECLGDFESFTEQGIRVEADRELYVDVYFGEESVSATLHMPVTIIKEDTVESLDEFSIASPIAFKKLFQLAKEITEFEMNYFFVEYTIRNLITSYSAVDDDYLPPIAGGLRFDNCANRVFWMASDVEESFKTMLSYNVPYLKVDNTDFERITITPEDEPDDENREIMQGTYDHMIQSASLAYYPTVRADFFYLPDFPLHLDLGTSGLIQPSALELNLVFMHLCMFDYSFFYNARFPVVVMLTDEASIVDEQPYIFQFALMGVLQNNFPRVSLNEVLADQLPDLEPEIDYQCSPDQFLSGESTVTVYDPDGRGIDDAVVLFQCGPSLVFTYDEEGNITGAETFGDTCFMGVTEGGVVESKFPPCLGGGHITVQHPDYLEQSFLTGDVVEGESFEEQITLQKVYNKAVDVRKFYVKPPPLQEQTQEYPGVVLDELGEVTECHIYDDDKPMQDHEQALITITKLDVENGIIKGSPVVLFIPGENATLDIAAGKYLVDILLIREEKYPGEMTIKAESESVLVVDEWGREETIYYPEEDILVEQIFTGGAIFEWDVKEFQLEESEQITFYIFDEDKPRGVTDIGAPVNHREACSEMNWQTIEPVIE